MKQSRNIDDIKNITEQVNNDAYYCFVVEFGLNGYLNGYGENVTFHDYQEAVEYIEKNSHKWDYCYLKAVKRIKVWNDD